MSVYIKELDKHFIDYLPTILTYNGGHSVKVISKRPDNKLTKNDYPHIELTPINESMDTFRYIQYQPYLKSEITEDKVTMQSQSIPLRLDYRIDIYTTMRSHMNELSKRFNWEYLRPNNQRWHITDSFGNIQGINVNLLRSFKSDEFIEEYKIREFRYMYDFRVNAYIDEKDEVEYNRVKQIIIERVDY